MLVSRSLMWLLFCKDSISVTPKLVSEPSERIVCKLTTLSTVLPHNMLWDPHELLPIAPPIVARLLVLGSGAK